MILHGNFLGAAIVAIIYTVFILMHPSAVGSKAAMIAILIVLNALTIVLTAFAFK